MNKAARFTIGNMAFGAAIALAAAAIIAHDDSGRNSASTHANASTMHVAAPADAASYAIGYETARNAVEVLQADRVAFDANSLVQGFSDAVHAVAPAVDEVDMRAALTHLEREVSTRFAQERLGVDPVFRALADLNAKQSTEMLQRMSRREGAKQIDGGIWYVELQPGNGASPGASDVVTLTLTVRTADGVVVTEGVGKQFRISGMIDGGQRVLTRMSPGARWLVGIPADLAFGIGGLPPDIGPNQAVLVDCTLESVDR